MSARAPRYSIIVPYDDRRVSDERLLRTLASVAAQRYRDFEVRVVHDGPPSRALPDLRFLGDRLTPVQMTPQRIGASALRDHAMRVALGARILHLDAGNVLYPQALERLEYHAGLPVEVHEKIPLAENPDVLVYAILRRGLFGNGRQILAHEDPSRAMIFTGLPALPFNIFTMQAAIARGLWQAIGGWYDKSERGAGEIYSKLVRERGARYVPEVLGEY